MTGKWTLADEQHHDRQHAGATLKPDDRCEYDVAGAPLDRNEKCLACERGPRRPAYMLVNGNVMGTPLTLRTMPALLRDLRAS